MRVRWYHGALLYLAGVFLGVTMLGLLSLLAGGGFSPDLGDYYVAYWLSLWMPVGVYIWLSSMFIANRLGAGRPRLAALTALLMGALAGAGSLVLLSLGVASMLP